MGPVGQCEVVKCLYVQSIVDEVNIVVVLYLPARVGCQVAVKQCPHINKV